MIEKAMNVYGDNIKNPTFDIKFKLAVDWITLNTLHSKHNRNLVVPVLVANVNTFCLL